MGAPRTTRASSAVAQRQAVLNAIARREWLLQVLVLSAAACRRSSDPGLARGSTVIVYAGRVGFYGYPAPNYLVFQPLVTANERGELEGRLADRWTHSPDFREWTFQLRAGLRWHDGAPVTAHDVKFTLDLLAHPGVDEEYGPDFIDPAVVVDDFTIRIRFRSVNPRHLVTRGTTLYYPKHLLEKLDPETIGDWPFWTHPVGNGPFRFVRYVPELVMELEASPEYYRGRPRIARVVLKLVKGSSLTDALSGNVDIVSDSNPADSLRLTADSRLRAYHEVRPQAYAILWNHSHPLFSDVRVRRALTLAINRRELLSVLNFPEDLPLVDGPAAREDLQAGKAPAPLAHDSHEAIRLLDDAGWHLRGPDGVRERGNRRFEFTTLVD